MNSEQPNNPLHGLKLEQIVTQLVERYGWEGLTGRIDINCFKSDPSVKSSLKFLRKTPWAREKVESLYLSTFAPAGSGKSRPGKPGATKPKSANPKPDNAEPARPDPWKKHRR